MCVIRDMSTLRDMSASPLRPLAECDTPREALAELCAGFKACPEMESACVEVAPEQMPEAYRRLLVHENHMTATLQEHFRSRLDLYVLEHRDEGDLYSRRIYLARPKSTDAVELGVVRLDLRCIPEPARSEILARRAPLGAILMRHNIRRRVEPRWFLVFPAGSAVLRWFGLTRQGPFYGRLATIYCDDEPAIEVLEIVTLWESGSG
jgi:chorismate-pyruvate lyase